VNIILGAMAKLRNAAINLLKSVCPPIRIKQLVSCWTYFLFYAGVKLALSIQSVDKIQVRHFT